MSGSYFLAIALSLVVSVALRLDFSMHSYRRRYSSRLAWHAVASFRPVSLPIFSLRVSDPERVSRIAAVTAQLESKAMMLRNAVGDDGVDRINGAVPDGRE